MKTFTAKKLITFSDSDLAGYMFFARAFDLAHQTIEQFISDTDMGWQKWFKNPEFKVPLRHAEADYFSPIIPGQELKIQVSVKKISESSVHFSTQFFHQETLCCEVKTVHSFVNADMTQKISVPPIVIQNLEA